MSKALNRSPKTPVRVPRALRHRGVRRCLAHVRRRASSFALASGLLLSAADAFSQVQRASPPPPPDEVVTLERSTSRRTGLALGLSLQGGLATSSGYPNEPSKIGDPRFESRSGSLPGGRAGLFVGGALTDELVLGVWFANARFENARYRAETLGGGLRVEAFPFRRLWPTLRDFAFFTELGVGTATLEGKFNGAPPKADGAQSHLSLGVFHESRVGRLLGGNLVLGPTLEYAVVTSTALENHTVQLGLRAAFYGGP